MSQSQKKPQVKRNTPLDEQGSAPEQTTAKEEPKARLINHMKVKYAEQNPAGQLKAGFIPPLGERKLFHAEVWRKGKYDENTGKLKAIKQLRAFEPREWDQFIKNAVRIGYEYEIFWTAEPYL